ncbi:hypothetical protein MERGE_000330 [Pneumocystis wakefieldiae]|uniref:HMG box domain-containing protein n=1 Tax=Pneumocystis wakefieldiae TaxID=38082 RepID=A0A899FV63_9ASCO|nr:hypothetical protein MERGE_000330 [Pneumocystis wakefieldiae]
MEDESNIRANAFQQIQHPSHHKGFYQRTNEQSLTQESVHSQLGNSLAEQEALWTLLQQQQSQSLQNHQGYYSTPNLGWSNQGYSQFRAYPQQIASSSRGYSQYAQYPHQKQQSYASYAPQHPYYSQGLDYGYTHHHTLQHSSPHLQHYLGGGMNAHSHAHAHAHSLSSIRMNIPKNIIDPSPGFQSTMPTVASSSNTIDIINVPEERNEGSNETVPEVRYVVSESFDRTIVPSLKSSIPPGINHQEYTRDCVNAAIASRLSPYHLSESEHMLLRTHLTHLQITSYLNIRNAILRLWVRNPLLYVDQYEALGIAHEERHFNLVKVCWELLVREGYINFGCINIPKSLVAPSVGTKTIVVVGAGISGLASARQLESLFRIFSNRFNHQIPKVVLLEARGRLGGRVYSHKLTSLPTEEDFPKDKLSTVDLGAQIITGFAKGNPLSTLLVKQLGLPMHFLSVHNITLYDSNGEMVLPDTDSRAELLFNYILEIASKFKSKEASVNVKRVLEGDKNMVDAGVEPRSEGGRVISKIEDNEATIPLMEDYSEINLKDSNKLDQSSSDDYDKKSDLDLVSFLRKIGFQIKENVSLDINFDDIVSMRNPTLGHTMSKILSQYQSLIDLTDLDMKLLNWHYANLEYANGTNLSNLSLYHWDQDDGNEFKGAHAMVKGGYSTLAYALAYMPTPLEIHHKTVVSGISYNNKKAVVYCENGTVIDADKVIITVPLGVLKKSSIQFNPPLPEWKMKSIERLSFGLLNKIILVYENSFWDVNIDVFGSLSEPDELGVYDRNRGRFYIFWNCIKTSGQPVLLALMAGDSAIQMENETDNELIQEATRILQNIYPGQMIPYPKETIITRWGKDKFCYGSYSYVGPEASGKDYDIIAMPVENTLFFAGEATSRTHPATVHGAYLSGLKAAQLVLDSLIGPLEIPENELLIPMKQKSTIDSSSRTKRKAQDDYKAQLAEFKDAQLERHNKEVERVILERLGPKPSAPQRSTGNPFLVFQKSQWNYCKNIADRNKQKETGNPQAKATKNEIRATLGKTWRNLTEDEKKPFFDIVAENRLNFSNLIEEYNTIINEYNIKTEEIRAEMKARLDAIPISQEELELKRLAKEQDIQEKKIKAERRREQNLFEEDSSESFDDDYQDNLRNDPSYRAATYLKKT